MANPVLPVVGLRTHSQRVCTLYKKALRTMESYYHSRLAIRLQAVLLRDRFDKNARECDMRKAVQMLKDGEEELFLKQHHVPKRFHKGPGGNTYGRVVEPPDWVLDYWHPLEKAQYPEYFKRREQRKLEFIKMWEEQFGKHDPKKDSHH